MEPGNRPHEPAGSSACQVTRHRAGDARDTVDRVVDETPVALVFNGIAHTVMMATPMRAAIKPYSIAVTPSSFFKKRFRADISYSPYVECFSPAR